MSLILGWRKKKVSKAVDRKLLASTKKENIVVNFLESLYSGAWGLHECQALYRHKCYYVAQTGEEVHGIRSEALKKKVSSEKARFFNG